MMVLELQPTTFAAVVTERLEADICDLAGHITAATARWVLMIAEYDDRQGWAQWGCRSAAHWLSWKCGMGLHTAREKLRVGHALSSLPIARAAFERGELSYSQVRSITRVAGAHNEAAFVDIARYSTAQQLERLVAATVKADKIWDQGFAAAQLADRSFQSGFDYDNLLYTAGLRLPPDDGRLLDRAMQLAAKQIQAERGDQGPDTTREQLLADALMMLVSSFLNTGRNEGNGTDDYRSVIFADDTVINPDEGGACDCGDEAGAPPVRDAPRAHLKGGATLTAETIRRIWCDSAVTRLELRDGVIVEINEPTRIISASLRRALGLRDSQCRFPGCCAKRVDAHHIRYRSHKGPTTLANLLSLCRFHHKLIHEGGYTISRSSNGELRFYNSQGRQLHNGSALTANGSALVANDGADALRRQHQELGIDINPDTIVGHYCGDKLDMDYAVSVLSKQNMPGATRTHAQSETDVGAPAGTPTR